MSAVAEKKPRLTTSAMIASIASEGQKTRPAPFGHALVAEADMPVITLRRPSHGVCVCAMENSHEISRGCEG